MSTSAIDPPRVEVFATVGRSFRFVWTERNDFITLALLPIVGLAVIGTLIGRPDQTLQGDGSVSFGAIGIVWLFLALNFAIGVFFGVAWHRRFLVPREGLSLASALSWKPRHARFLKVSLALVFGPAVVILPIGIVLAFMGSVGILLLFPLIFGVVLIVLRLSLMLPAVSVDMAMTIEECMAFTKGNTWRIAGLFLLVTLIVSVADSLLRLVLTALFGDDPGVLGRFVDAFALELIAFGAVAVGISALSSAYLQLLQGPTAVARRLRVTNGPGEEEGRHNDA